MKIEEIFDKIAQGLLMLAITATFVLGVTLLVILAFLVRECIKVGLR